MKKNHSEKGFTLIELLIVIAIIGVLAVAFLPTLLGAPAKGRDTSRIADLQKIQKVLINADLEGRVLPAGSTCVNSTSFAAFVDDFGGSVPTDPQPANVLPGPQSCSGATAGQYRYHVNPGADNSFDYGLYAHVELAANANTTCSAAYLGNITAPVAATAVTDLCFAILTQ